MPQHQVGRLGPGEPGVGGEQRPSLVAARRPARRPGGPATAARSISVEPTASPSMRRRAASAARRRASSTAAGEAALPGPGDGGPHQRRAEVVEGGDHRVGPHRTHGRRPRGEVPGLRVEAQARCRTRRPRGRSRSCRAGARRSARSCGRSAGTRASEESDRRPWPTVTRTAVAGDPSRRRRPVGAGPEPAMPGERRPYSAGMREQVTGSVSTRSRGRKRSRRC